MPRKKTNQLTVKGVEVKTSQQAQANYLCITDIAKYKNADRPDELIRNWLRNRNTLEFLGIWEQLNNPDFNPVEFDGLKNQAGLNSFTLSPKQWVERTQAIGISSKAGRYGGTYAHEDIAFEFAAWISVEFKLYLIKDFQRLKAEENDRLRLDWSLQRTLAKVNYSIHTDAIKERLIPAILTSKETSFVYASEADLLNMALFGTTAKEWRKANPDLKGNIRDHATLEQLVVLSNLESLNSVFIRQEIPTSKRLSQLNGIAVNQMTSLLNSKKIQKLKDSEPSKADHE